MFVSTPSFSDTSPDVGGIISDLEGLLKAGIDYGRAVIASKTATASQPTPNVQNQTLRRNIEMSGWIVFLLFLAVIFMVWKWR